MSTLTAVETPSFTPSQVNAMVRFAATQVEQRPAELIEWQGWLMFSTGCNVPLQAFVEVVEQFEAYTLHEDSDLKYWFGVPNTHEERKLILERIEDELNARVNDLVSILTGGRA